MRGASADVGSLMCGLAAGPPVWRAPDRALDSSRRDVAAARFCRASRLQRWLMSIVDADGTMDSIFSGYKWVERRHLEPGPIAGTTAATSMSSPLLDWARQCPAARRWRRIGGRCGPLDQYETPDRVSVLDGGTLGLALLPYLEDARASFWSMRQGGRAARHAGAARRRRRWSWPWRRDCRRTKSVLPICSMARTGAIAIPHAFCSSESSRSRSTSRSACRRVSPRRCHAGGVRCRRGTCLWL